MKKASIIAILTKGALLALAYVVTAKFGLSFAVTTQQVTAIWPPTGLALFALLLLGWRYWPGILVGAFIANSMANEPWFVAGGIAIGNTLEAVAGAYLLKTIAGIKPRELLGSTRNILALVVLAALLATAVSATLGTATLAAGGIISWANYTSVWVVWWVGDMMGSLVFLPVLLSLTNRAYLSHLIRRLPEAGAMLFSLTVCGLLIFTRPAAGDLLIPPAPYMIFPMLIWAALRFTQAGVGAALLVLAIIATGGTLAGLGPFAQGGSVENDLISLQLFLFVTSVTSLLVAAVVAERLQAAQSLRHQAAELKKTQAELKEANRRATDILSEVLEADSPRRRS